MAYLVTVTEKGLMDYHFAIASSKNELLAIIMQITEACGVDMPSEVHDSGSCYLAEGK